jgi:glucosamine--fructose-6-phosphate aminotransferase (isomerizing)
VCGIFGLVVQHPHTVRRGELKRLVRLLYTYSERRGRESSGIALNNSRSIEVLKRSVRGKIFGQLPELVAMLSNLTSEPFAIMGHTRMVTSGDAANVNNNQPILRNNLACIHNGIIVNDAALWQRYPALSRAHQVDTEIFLALVEHFAASGKPTIQAVVDSMNNLEGANTFALMRSGASDIILATSNGSLYYLSDPESGIALFASERCFLQTILATILLPIDKRLRVKQLLAGRGLILSAEGSLHTELSLAGDLPVSQPANRKGTILDRGSNSDGAVTFSSVNLNQLARLEKETLVIDQTAIKRLKRCTKCLLPETFPFLRFDQDGVCSICARHKPLTKSGKEGFLEKLKYSDPGRKLSCLAPVSGGRDSCYGLHIMVREMGIRPVAYTYDWGMVTDLARRNISRMCGELGIEHIIVSADIARKRRFIRQNVTAWLKKPHLGSIPLFMAGDKQFFYFAEKLRQQMSLKSIIFSMNPLERTDFKMGFCGINETYDKVRHYDPVLINKLRLTAFYLGQYVLNPAYLNSSLLDTAGAYLSYYALPKRYEQLFDYIPWMENEVESTLINVYGWELAEDTISTWRIGDGTAAFYNYIYWKVAGFTENDTFRSNQIREGLIDRDVALARIEEENRPRVTSLAWYFDAIGLDALAAIKRINAIPTLY